MKLKCLLVEDVTYIREIYHYTLRDQNFEIIGEAVDGIDALEKIKTLQPDIVILDLVLPLKNGLDVLKEAHQLSPKSRYLVVSSLDDPKTREQAKSLGASEYLTKPFTKIQLIDSLNRISEIYAEVQNG